MLMLDCKTRPRWPGAAGESTARLTASEWSGKVKVRRNRLTRHAVFAGLRSAEKFLAKYRKSFIGLAVIKKLVGRDRLTNLLNS